jgi:hypothetical protein
MADLDQTPPFINNDFVNYRVTGRQSLIERRQEEAVFESCQSIASRRAASIWPESHAKLQGRINESNGSK